MDLSPVPQMQELGFIAVSLGKSEEVIAEVVIPRN